MGNSGSNSGNSGANQQHCPSGNQEMGRGWTHSFPRELTRHHSQPPGHKVLPEPPNQRLRATNNGSIIHNGGTISGRRPSALTLPHDLNKQGVYRSRSTSASNLGPRSRSSEQHQQHHCCLYRSGDPRCRETEMTELKRFGSEPDLRYSPNEHRHSNHHSHHHHHHHQQQDQQQQQEQHNVSQSSYYPERESRYRGKKKYKAPAPPTNGDGSSPDSYKWEIGHDPNGCCRPEDDNVQPPPRRSRLFKTRAETKKAQTSWNPALLSPTDNDSFLDSERRWRNPEKKNPGEENRSVWQERSSEQDRWCRDDRRRSNKYNGKNTLQRSLSSPEFQAELMQVARKVRYKLNHSRRVGPVGAATVSSSDPKSETHQLEKSVSTSDINRQDYPERKSFRHREQDHQEDRKVDKRKPRTLEETFDGRTEDTRSSARFRDKRTSQTNARGENRMSRSQEVRGYDQHRTATPKDSGTVKERLEERELDNDPPAHRRRIVEKSYTYEERVTSNGTTEFVSGRKSLNERLEIIGQSLDERLVSERHRNNNERPTDMSGPRHRKTGDAVDAARTRSESPVFRNCRDRMDVRGQGSGRESTPEPPRGKERKRRTQSKDDCFINSEKRWLDNHGNKTNPAKPEINVFETKSGGKQESKEIQRKQWNGLPPSGKAQPKTYYFSVDDGLSREIRASCELQQVDHGHTRLQGTDSTNLIANGHNRTDDSKSQRGIDDIALKLRPTLPKKQLEIPRFSPSAAWRLLSALETPGPTMSTASEEVPVMFEERIERLARPPPPLVALSPRSSHDKSGDSGISGDAGAPNDDSLDVSTTNRAKTPATRPAWTPQQDLGEESSSDAGVDSPPPMAPSIKFPPRAHVFSLSLPRDDSRHCLYAVDTKNSKENSSFNSLQKLKRSVSGALGLAQNELESRKRIGESLGENWLLSTSAPNSLQHSQANHIETMGNASPGWENHYNARDMEDEVEDLQDSEDKEEKSEFPMIMKPPSFSYLATGGHVMYLPEANDAGHTMQSLNYRNSSIDIGNSNGVNSKYSKNTDEPRIPNKIGSFGINGISINGGSRSPRDMGIYRERSLTDFESKSRKYPNFFKSCENISEMKQRSASPTSFGPENLQDTNGNTGNSKSPTKNSKGKRFTFQSTVRQIERRRLAEKLSREAEAKERQRKSELEVMRKVEEEFQRKRAREKANIRQQLRLYSMDENSNSLPPAWDSSQVSRADPDGAPSSSASSPTSAPPEKMASNRMNSVGSDEYQHRKRISETRAQQQQQPAQQREYKDYRSKYYDWAPDRDSSSNIEVKQTTVHPKVVYDIPKSSHVFVDANIHTAKPATVTSTPRSDNYRKDFAHGAVAARSSLASSDSELSQPNTRPHSRQNGNKSKPLRSRSVSPARSDGAGSAGEESPVEAVKQERNVAVNGFTLNGVQPFVREKSYRPIAFNPRPPAPPVPS